jgi:hypothetical protein
MASKLGDKARCKPGEHRGERIVRRRPVRTNTKTAKCPGCCPDAAGAIFEREVVSFDVEPWIYEWRCRNCGHVLPAKASPKATKLTPSQEQVVERLRATFGGSVEVDLQPSRKAWVRGRNDERSIYDGTVLGGWIGPMGAYELTLYRLGPKIKVTDRIGWSVYIGETAEEKAQRTAMDARWDAIAKRHEEGSK